MGNISKNKKEDLIDKIDKIKNFLSQEERSLRLINDSSKKVIIVKDNIKTWRNDNGTVIMGLKEFLLSPGSLNL